MCLGWEQNLTPIKRLTGFQPVICLILCQAFGNISSFHPQDTKIHSIATYTNMPLNTSLHYYCYPMIRYLPAFELHGSMTNILIYCWFVWANSTDSLLTHCQKLSVFALWLLKKTPQIYALFLKLILIFETDWALPLLQCPLPFSEYIAINNGQNLVGRCLGSMNDIFIVHVFHSLSFT